MGDFLFGIGIALGLAVLIISLVCLGIKAFDEDSLIAKIVFALITILIISGLIIGGLTLGVQGINK